jgi:hypothetical protein
MIDTDKYEGHTPAPWKINEIHSSQRWTGRKPVDVLLAEDAPLLLAEVKRLREELDGREAYIKRLSEQLARATKWAYQQVCHNDSAMMDFDDYVWGEQE